MSPQQFTAPLGGILLAGAFLLTGCASQTTARNGPDDSNPAATTAQAPQPSGEAGVPGQGQELFDSPDAAVVALLSAVQSNDHRDIDKIFGPDAKGLVTGDPVTDANNYKSFAQETLERAQLEERNPNTAILHIGKEDWPFPIPLSRTSGGKWFFDTNAGRSEVLARHIGADELETISICRAYVQAQREYASQDHNGDEVLEYAQRLRSSPGKQDGLYWPASGDQPQSPFGPLVAQASGEGYAPISGSPRHPEPFHGYYYRILKAQGSATPGGAYNYVINGHMIAGFALIAYPAEYGKSGVMTFIVNHQGKVFQKDLGADTDAKGKAIQEYNPDPTWKQVKD
ncbi:MAG TPA: DUF2950 family protein [Phycisphaerae bacterium]|nr:DUF2950 family protein [Phycisphaerae bacterium]